MLTTQRFGSDPYDGVSANGWFVMDGDEAVAGPFVDRAVASRHMDAMTTTYGIGGHNGGVHIFVDATTTACGIRYPRILAKPSNPPVVCQFCTSGERHPFAGKRST